MDFASAHLFNAPPIALSKPSWSNGLGNQAAREGAALMTEQLAFEQSRWNVRTIDLNEGAILCCDLLAGRGLALNQYRGHLRLRENVTKI